jgi:hypothetical protein
MIAVLDRIVLMLMFAGAGVLYLTLCALFAQLVLAVGARWERAKERQESVPATRALDASPSRDTARRSGVPVQRLPRECAPASSVVCHSSGEERVPQAVA